MSRPDRGTSPLPRIAYTVPEVAASLGLSETETYRLVRNGQIASRKVGRRVLIPAKAIEDFMAATS